MVTNRASGSADQADGTTQKRTKINRERSRLIWTETCNPVPQVAGVVRTSGRSEVNKNLGERRVAVNGPYVSGCSITMPWVSGPESILQECPILGKPHASPLPIHGKSRMRKRARTDLCGGRPVMVVPTATVIVT